MKNRSFLALAYLLTYLLVGCVTTTGREADNPPPNKGAFYSIDAPIQCVAYAREVSGIPIYGDAHTWWYQAKNAGYKRGHVPRDGAILVLSKTSKLKYGHLAVVTKVLNEREIEVTHSNWGDNHDRRCVIYNAMRVQDLSNEGDWSRVRFWNYEINGWGLPYAVSGFIYNNPKSELLSEIRSAG